MNNNSTPEVPEEPLPPSYFDYPQFGGLISAHIFLMVFAWVFVLPIAVMFSIAKSRYRFYVQSLFLAVNAMAVALSSVYNARTPDLYPHNAHHKMGWILTLVVSGQVVTGLISHLASILRSQRSGGMSHSNEEEQSFIPLDCQANDQELDRFQNWQASPLEEQYRWSNDSGQGTEPKTDSTPGSPNSPTGLFPPLETPGEPDSDDYGELTTVATNYSTILHRAARSGLPNVLINRIPPRLLQVIDVGYQVVDRTILLAGFAALSTGVVTYGRFFEGLEIFSGLAHWIKGGVFTWIGIFALGRWAGSFGDLGWAWNVNPRDVSSWTPTAEFVESFLIFFYGSTNVFLEHLGNEDGTWTAQDLEHISITILFIGGGLCGMLIESTKIRTLLNTTSIDAIASLNRAADEFDGSREEENQSRTEDTHPSLTPSLNPIPALVILLVGIMMSSHTQQSHISSMIHQQWGNLLTAGAVARGFTYLLMYLKPPRSSLPSRPPTEVIVAFCLMAGGLIFMASSRDTVQAMERHELDVMFMYTVTMGLVATLMAWMLVVIAAKGWATRREARASHPRR